MPDRLGLVDGIDEALLRLAIEEHERCVRPRLDRLWAYFRNPGEPVGTSGWRERLAQERGLPARLTGRGERTLELDDRARTRREVVIENDIGWRVQSMVDFMLGRPVRVVSRTEDGAVRSEVDRVVDAVWEASGGLALMQDAALLGHVYGYVDLVVRVDEEALASAAGMDAVDAARAGVRIEVVDPTRGVAFVSASDYRELDGFAVHAEREANELEEEAPARRERFARLFGRARAGDGSRARKRSTVTEVFEPGRWRLWVDGEVVEEREVSVVEGVPVVHIQNMSQPFRYAGISEVEQLIPLQDELNTRLSDRASRVTMQSFQMYRKCRLLRQ